MKTLSFENKNISTLLGLTLVLAAVLRFYKLDFQSFWFDEIHSWSVSHSTSAAEAWTSIAEYEYMPPGYFMLLWLVTKVVGVSEFSYRFPSAIFGLACVPMMYLLAKEFFSKEVGLIAAMVLAGSWVPIFYSQEARPYSLLLLAVCLSFYFWIRLMESSKRSWRLWFGYTVSGLLCVYSHYLGALVLLLQYGLTWAHMVFGQCRKKSHARWLPWIGVGVLWVFLFLPWLSHVWRDLTNPGKVWFPIPPPKALLWYLKWVFNDSRILAAICTIVTTVYLAGKARTWSKVKLRERQVLAVLLLWFAAPPLIVFLKSHFSTPMWTSRNLIISVPAAYLLFSAAVWELSQRVPRALRSLSISLAILVFPIQLVFGQRYYSVPTKTQFREAVQYAVVDRDLKETDLVVLDIYGSTLMYYLERFSSGAKVGVEAPNESVVPYLSEALAKMQPNQNVWCFNCIEPAVKVISQHFLATDVKEFFGLKVIRFEPLKAKFK